MDTLNTLSLCSGGGGLDLGLSLALGRARCVCWVEWEAFACSVLAQRMEAKQLAEAPVWSDLRTFDGRPWRGSVDIITGGYPCQPFSLAGKRRGSDDPRHLWPHVARIVGEVQPPICFFENVSGHLSLGFQQVAGDLEAMDYEVAAGLFTAAEVRASHQRERLFILAVANSNQNPQFRTTQTRLDPLANPASSGLEERESRGSAVVETPLFPPGPDDADAWRPLVARQPDLCPVVDGVARHRVRELFGNGVVPLQAAYAFCSLWAALRVRSGG